MTSKNLESLNDAPCPERHRDDLNDEAQGEAMHKGTMNPTIAILAVTACLFHNPFSSAQGCYPAITGYDFRFVHVLIGLPAFDRSLSL